MSSISTSTSRSDILENRIASSSSSSSSGLSRSSTTTRQNKSSRHARSTLTMPSSSIINNTEAARGPGSGSGFSIPRPRHLAVDRLGSSSTARISSSSLSSLPRSSSTSSTMSLSSMCREASVLPNHTSIRRSHSTRSRLHPSSPAASVLPTVDRMSYFPPFEDMGSDPVSVCHSSSSAGTGAPSESQAGPSTSASPKRTHSKGRSLTSLAGIISPLWSMSMAVASPSATKEKRKEASHSPWVDGLRGPEAAATADDLVEALSKRCTQSKRRVLEPLATTDMGGRVERAGLPQNKNMVERRRRMRSEFEVESILTKQQQQQQSLECIAAVGLVEEEESVVESMVAMIPKSHTTSRRPRPNLTVPLPTLPTWRFPLPSPPVTSLSPDIPNQAFRPIDNPLTSASGSATTSSASSVLNSPVPELNLAWEQRDGEDSDELEDVEEGLATMSSPIESGDEYRCSDPMLVTPPPSRRKRLSGGKNGNPLMFNEKRARAPQEAITMSDLDVFLQASLGVLIQDHQSQYSQGTQGMYLRPKLARTVSQVSSDSKETIRPGVGVAGSENEEEDEEVEEVGEVTPKASLLGGVA